MVARGTTGGDQTLVDHSHATVPITPSTLLGPADGNFLHGGAAGTVSDAPLSLDLALGGALTDFAKADLVNVGGVRAPLEDKPSQGGVAPTPAHSTVQGIGAVTDDQQHQHGQPPVVPPHH
jgi:hypothetical protein